MKIKVYMASLFSRREEMEVLSKLLEKDYEVVSRWVYGGEAVCGSQQEISDLDLEDVKRSDIVMSFTQERGTYTPGGGRHVEFGYGLALEKRMIIIGPRENVFHYDKNVEVYPSIGHFLRGEHTKA